MLPSNQLTLSNRNQAHDASPEVPPPLALKQFRAEVKVFANSHEGCEDDINMFIPRIMPSGGNQNTE